MPNVRKATRLVIKTEHSKYSEVLMAIRSRQSKYLEVLKAKRSDVKLLYLGADVRSIIHTCTSPTKVWRSTEVLGKVVDVRALTAEETLKVKNLGEVTKVDELVTALRQQCEMQVVTAAVRLRKGHRWPRYRYL